MNRYDPSVEEDDTIVGTIWTRRQALAAAGLANIIGCGWEGGTGGMGATLC